MLTVKEAAKRLGICQSIVYQLCASGSLPHYRIGAPGKRGKVLIESGELDAFLADHRQGSKQPPARPLKLEHLTL
ncbi:MAG: helix-turn-helix domain-containing protein [Candidatus Hydrogenedentes bacterium]|nr:helix-turn-helix domain-containing protein [Candidatus Hydrogenedentota bacterium]